MLAFAKKFVEWEWKSSGGIYTNTPVRVYASAMRDKSMYRFHINSMAMFKQMLADRGASENMIQWVTVPDYEPAKYPFEMKPGWVARPHQVPMIEFLSRREQTAKLIEAATGQGKGLVSLMALVNLGERVVIVVKPKYVEKWQNELIEKFKDIEDKILIVQGSKDLKMLTILAEQGELDDPVIIISNATLRNWIRDYEEKGDGILELGYACRPQEFFAHLKAGVRLIDETHEDYHFFFKLDTYTNVKTSISLTATLLTRQPFEERMYETQFPPAERLAKAPPPRYVDSVNFLYRFKTPEKIRTEEWGSTSYSHTAFEKSIIRHVPTLNNYMALVKEVLDAAYIKDKKPGERAIVFAASVEMCTRLTKHLSTAYPQLDVRRYVEQDPYENVIEPDIRVTTIFSGGTAVDIPDLSVAVMTTALDSIKGNIQALGRIRERQGKMLFYFFTAENLPKHIKYAEAKKILFKDRVKTYREISSSLRV